MTHLNLWYLELMKTDALKAHANENLECTVKDLKTEIAGLFLSDDITKVS